MAETPGMATKSQKLAAQTAHERREAWLQRTVAEAPARTPEEVATMEGLMQRSLTAHAHATRP
jgi:hypothetical protein